MGLRRSLTPEDDQLEKLGNELLAWCRAKPTEDKPEKHLFFAQWYSGEKHILRKTWKAMIQHPNFRPYYEEAAILLGVKLVTGSIKDSLAHRFLRIYHHDVREDEDEVAKKKSDDITSSLENIRSCLAELTDNSKSVSTASGSSLETEQPILDKGCSREACQVQPELGTAGNIEG